MTTYNVIRKHSSDTNTSIVATVESAKEAKQFIANELKELKTMRTPHTVQKWGRVTNILFGGPAIHWSVGFWYEKAQ
jgi:hypothetical protein